MELVGSAAPERGVSGLKYRNFMTGPTYCDKYRPANSLRPAGADAWEQPPKQDRGERSMGFLRLKVTIGGLAALLCAAVLVAGCGSSGGDSTGSSDSNGAESTSTDSGGSEEVAFAAKRK